MLFFLQFAHDYLTVAVETIIGSFWALVEQLEALCKLILVQGVTVDKRKLGNACQHLLGLL